MAGNQKNEEFLGNFGGITSNDLTQILNCDTETDDQTPTILNNSNYHDIKDILETPIFSDKSQFKVLSFNTESLPSKINNIKIFLEMLKTNEVSFDAICISECWLENFGSDLEIPGYQHKFLPRNGGFKGGLITYIKDSYEINDLNLYKNSNSWEGQFIEVKGNGLRNKLLLSNIYIPPRGRVNFVNFKDEFFTILNRITDKYKNIIIAGDTNADALKFNTDSCFKDYFDNLTNCGLLPLITLPTHFGTLNGSIIDHIYAKTETDINSLYAGILIHKFSNHLAVFVSLPLKKEKHELPKYIQISKNDTQSYNQLNTELNNIDWAQAINTYLVANPNDNYNKFHKLLTDLKEKHLPSKLVRFKRHKHKGNAWITNGLIASIKQKDYLYKKLHKLPKNHINYESCKTQFKNYEINLKSLINTVKKEFYENQFNRYKHDIKNTWNTIKKCS